MGDRSKKKRASDIGGITGEKLGYSFPSPRSRLSLDGKLKETGNNNLQTADLNRSYGGAAKSIFGSPSYPSPLDRVRSGKNERAAQLGLSFSMKDSFEVNQSFPKAMKPVAPVKNDLDITMAIEKKKKLDDFKGTGLNDVSFAAATSRGSFANNPELSSSLGDSWAFFNYVGDAQGCGNFPSTVRNPNKAIVTINAKTSEILIANEMACELFGFPQDELLGNQLADLLTSKSNNPCAIRESHLEADGQIIETSGQVMEAVDASGLVIPVSVWIRRLDTEEPRCLVVMEPVERTTGKVTFDSTGTILDCDGPTAHIFGFMSQPEVMGLKMNSLVPSFVLPQAGRELTKDVRKQRMTGRTKDGVTFPLCIAMKIDEEPIKNCNHDESLGGGEEIQVYKGVIWVFANISGMITVLPNGQIHSINNNFALMMFGYTQQELIGKDITTIIPNFCQETEETDIDLPLPPMDEEEEIKDEELDLPLPPSDKETSEEYKMEEGTDISKEQISKGVKAKEEIAKEEIAKMEITDVEISKGATKVETSKEDAKVETSKEDIEKIELPENVKNSESKEKIETNMQPMSKCEPEENFDSVPTLCKLLLKQLKLNDKSNKSNGESGNESNTGNSINGHNEMDTRSDMCTSGNGGHVSPVVQNSVDQNTSELNIIPNSAGVHIESSDKNCCVKSVKINSASESSRLSKLRFTEEVTEKKEVYESPKKPVRSANRLKSDTTNSTCRDLFDDSAIDPDESLDDGDAVPHAGGFLPKMISTSTPAVQRSHAWHNPKLFTPQKDSGSCDISFTSPVSPFEQGRPQLLPQVEERKPVPPPRVESLDHSLGIEEGSYIGKCRHKDRQELGIIYQMKKVELEDGKVLFCLWVSRDPEDPYSKAVSFNNMTLASSLDSSFGQSLATSHNASQNSTRNESSLEDTVFSNAEISGFSRFERIQSLPATPSPCPVADSPCPSTDPLPPTTLIPGSSPEYDIRYDTLQSIGKGAFGFVKLALRKENKEQVVVKFIKKSKVLTDAWVDDKELGIIPSEVSLLSNLNHPNIVKLVDFYEGEYFYQMVMEKHGSGMDLFEFIDRCPNLDEALASHIFGQIVSAVSYLHKHSILHRDIKDENIILNEYFAVKLIDFGSAAIMKPGHLFGTFCGTIEYASPEVLQGNKYEGPELEMWSLGVTLYTLVFGENPFYDIDETILGVLKPPFEVSGDLMEVIGWMLHPDPKLRATIQDIERDPWVFQPIDLEQYEWSEVLPNSEFTGNTAADNREDSTSDVECARGSHDAPASIDHFTMSDLDLDMKYLQDHRDHYLSDGQQWTEV